MRARFRVLISPAPWILIAIGLAVAVSAEEGGLPRELEAVGNSLTTTRPLPSSLVADLKTWVEPAEPLKIAGPIYFVGTRGLAAYLVATPAGHILLDGGMPSSAKDIEASIRKLGFKPEDIRLLLLTHAHLDHVGTMAYFKRLTDASVVVMARDVDTLRSGGKSDPEYGAIPAFYFPPVRADRTLKDGDSLTLGNVTMTARLTAGHTPGCTTWITTIQDGGKRYTVVFAGSTTVNPSTRLVGNAAYNEIAADYRRAFMVLESLKPDIWLTAHTDRFGFDDKRAHADQDRKSTRLNSSH